MSRPAFLLHIIRTSGDLDNPFQDAGTMKLRTHGSKWALDNQLDEVAAELHQEIQRLTVDDVKRIITVIRDKVDKR